MCGGEEVKVLDSFAAELGDLVYNGIYYIKSGPKDGSVIEFFDFATHLETRVANLGVVAILPIPISVSP